MIKKIIKRFSVLKNDQKSSFIIGLLPALCSFLLTYNNWESLMQEESKVHLKAALIGFGILFTFYLLILYTVLIKKTTRRIINQNNLHFPEDW